MRSFVLLVLIFATAAAVGHAATCTFPEGKAPRVRWRIDHYVYDASLRRSWKVLVDCDHPDAPPHMELVPLEDRSGQGNSARMPRRADSGNTKHEDVKQGTLAPVCVKAGEVVEVLNAPHGAASISMQGIAMQTALRGQRIRVRLTAGGHFISGVVRGPHLIELAGAIRPIWGKP